MAGFPLFVIICLGATVYFIVKSVKKTKEDEARKNSKQKKKQKTTTFPKKKSLSITVHLFKDGYGEKKFQLKKGHKFYVNEDGLKEISGEWDYDFWQITSNKTEYAFEWLRQDQNNNHVSVLNFWNGGDLSKSKKAISEDSALDVVQNSDWIPGLDKFLVKKRILPDTSNDKNPLSNKSTANNTAKLGKHKMSSWTQKETKNKVKTKKNTEASEAEEPTLSKGFGK